MAFRVGQKVVCVNDRGFIGRLPYPVKGSVYEITAIGDHPNCGVPSLRFAEFPWVSATDTGWLFASRFRPVVERKTDISIFTEILNGQRVPELTP